MTLARQRARPLFARRRTPTPAPPPAAPALTGCADGEHGILLARRLAGERALPTSEGNVILSLERLRRHMLVCGATGAGKTETLLRIAWTIAKTTDTPVFYLDGKGDRDTAMRFCALMSDAGRTTRVFPNEPYDAWRGAPHEIQSRLMEIIDYATDGPATWYRDLAKTVLRLACQHPDGPPRNTNTLLARIDQEALAAAHPTSTALAALTRDQIRQVRLRYEAFFGQTTDTLDGTWAWEDTPAAYLLLDSLALKEETAGLARLLFEDFAHYFTTRKPRHQHCLLIVDEFSALAQSSGMAARIEQARGFNTALILAPQVTAGIGDATETERITGSVETIICHRVNTPEPIITLAGTRKATEHSTHYTPGGATGEGSIRIQHQYKIDPNKVRALPPGHVYIINHGQAMHAQIHQAPTGRQELPQPHQTATASQPEPRQPRAAGVSATAAEAAPENAATALRF